MKKRMLAGLMAAAMSLSLAACGAPASTATTSSTAPAATSEGAGAAATGDEPVTLRFSWWGGDERLKATLAMIDQFEAKYPNITIEPEYGSSDGYNDKLATQLAAGTEPDIMQIEPGNMALLVKSDADYFVDLKAAGFDLSNFDEGYISQRINGGYDGRQLGIPTGMAGIALVVNKELAETIGINFTQDYIWDDLIEMGKKVREYDNSMYLLCDDKENISNMIARAYAKQLTGKQVISDDTGEQLMTQEEWTKVYQLIDELYTNEVVPPASYMASYSGDNTQSDPNWIGGKYVAAFTWISTAEVMTAANSKAIYSAGKFPLLADGASDGFFANTPQIMSISARSKHPAEAQLFLDYFFNNEDAMATLGTVRSVPPTEKARQICAANGSMSALLTACADNAANYSGIVDDAISYSQEGRQIMTDEIEAIGFDSITPEKAAEETYAMYNDMIKNQ